MKTPNYTYAGRLERLFANLLDTFFLLVPHGLLLKLTGMNDGALLTGFLCNLAYFTYFTGGKWQASPGQRILSIRVIRADGGRLGYLDALERFLAFVMPTLPMYASFIDVKVAPVVTIWLSMVWFLPILIRDNRTGMHDQICHQRVVIGRTS